MAKASSNKKGVVLFVVLGTLLIVIVLANVVLTLILSQSRLTHHQVSRIQAYYAAQAAMNLAFEKLRTGEWGQPTATTYTLCKSDCTVNDTDIPYPVTISISAPNSAGIRTINLTSTYTYTP